MSKRFGFFHEEGQEENKAYWGRMSRLGRMGKGVSMFRVRFFDDVPHKLHIHPKHDELVYVAAGSIEQTIGDQTVRLSVGESAYIGRGVPHKAVPLSANTEVVVVLSGKGHDYENIELEP